MLHEDDKIYFRPGICHHSDSSECFLDILNSKVIQQYQIKLFGTIVKDDLSDTNQQQTRPKHHTYKDHVYLNRLFLLSNLAWRR